jgi:hypothetical protein
LLIVAGSPDVPERIGLEQQLNTEACQQNAHKATEQKKYAFVRCIEGGSIVSQSLDDQDRQISSGPPPMEYLARAATIATFRSLKARPDFRFTISY